MSLAILVVSFLSGIISLCNLALAYTTHRKTVMRIISDMEQENNIKHSENQDRDRKDDKDSKDFDEGVANIMSYSVNGVSGFDNGR